MSRRIRERPEDPTFEWTNRRLRAAELLLAGLPKTQVAREVGVSRKTVYEWLQRSEFRARIHEQLDDHVSSTRRRRHLETNLLTNRVSRMARRATERAAQEMSTGDRIAPRTMKAMRSSLKNYRQLRRQERLDIACFSKGPGGRGAKAAPTAADKMPFRDFLIALSDGRPDIAPADLDLQDLAEVMDELDQE